MSKTLRAVVREGRIQLLEPVDLAEGTQVLVTLLPAEEAEFWLSASQVSLNTLWDNPEDDVYGQLLQE